MLFRDTGKKKLKTKDKILLEASMLFAKHGYAAVSIRDIAERVKIKSASIYAHYSSKEEIFDLILDNMKDIYLEYFVRLEQMMDGKTSFDEVLDCLFAELKQIYNIYIYYGVALAATEQFNNRKARAFVNDIYLKKGIEYTKAGLDHCIKKKWVKKFDTNAAATLIMNSVLVGSFMRVHEDMKHKVAYDATEMFTSLQTFIRSTVEVLQ